jgi:hypothetical protein
VKYSDVALLRQYFASNEKYLRLSVASSQFTRYSDCHAHCNSSLIQNYQSITQETFVRLLNSIASLIRTAKQLFAAASSVGAASLARELPESDFYPCLVAHGYQPAFSSSTKSKWHQITERNDSGRMRSIRGDGG